MKYVISLLSIGRTCMVIPIEVKWSHKTAQSLFGELTHDVAYHDRVGITENTYQLDGNTAELFNTSHFVFLGFPRPQPDLHSLPIGRHNCHTPAVVCTREYTGFEKCTEAIKYIQYITDTSIADPDIETPETLDEMLKKYGTKIQD